MNWYNENEPYAAAWLENLIAAGHLGYGIVDNHDLRTLDRCMAQGFRRAHFFAGIGGWELALKLAGWPKDRLVWTGSCPCQPFSAAGKRKGIADERHLWPCWLDHIRQLHPPTIFGEQVASAAGRQWLAGVRTDLEALGYAVGYADLPAAGVGAPHIRQRLYWVADAQYTERRPELQEDGDASRRDGSGGRSNAGRLGNPNGARPQGWREYFGQRPDQCAARTAGESGTLWSAYELIACADGKARRIESGTFPLAHGVPARVAQLRAYGNAIVPQVAAVFIRAFLEETDQ